MKTEWPPACFRRLLSGHKKEPKRQIWSSEWEREAIGERTRDALSHKRRNGERVGNLPYGYRLAEDGLHVEADAGEQAVVARVDELRTHHTLRQIAARLNEQGLRTRRGSPWRSNLWRGL